MYLTITNHLQNQQNPKPYNFPYPHLHQLRPHLEQQPFVWFGDHKYQLSAILKTISNNQVILLEL